MAFEAVACASDRSLQVQAGVSSQILFLVLRKVFPVDFFGNLFGA